MKTITIIAVLLAVLLFPSGSLAGSIVIKFENLNDLDPVTTQFPGLIFSNASVLTAGISLNEFEFPPYSGRNVIFDDGGPILITFLNPITSFQGYFTYNTSLTLQAFDASDNLLGSVTSAFSNNLALSGDPGSSPNEFLEFIFPGIYKISITGDPFGGSFTADNVTYEPKTVPEPSTLILSCVALGGLALTQLGWGKRYPQPKS